VWGYLGICELGVRTDLLSIFPLAHRNLGTSRETSSRRMALQWTQSNIYTLASTVISVLAGNGTCCLVCQDMSAVFYRQKRPVAFGQTWKQLSAGDAASSQLQGGHGLWLGYCVTMELQENTGTVIMVMFNSRYFVALFVISSFHLLSSCTEVSSPAFCVSILSRGQCLFRVRDLLFHPYSDQGFDQRPKIAQICANCLAVGGHFR